MLETKNPPGWLRIEASFFSAAFENPSIVSEYMMCASLLIKRGAASAVPTAQFLAIWLIDLRKPRSLYVASGKPYALPQCNSQRICTAQCDGPTTHDRAHP